jgi:hypothetical protein
VRIQVVTSTASLNPEDVRARRHAHQPPTRLAFGVRGLYGLSRESVPFPLNRSESIESGQICVTIDPEADSTTNVGLIDYTDGTLVVRYGVQAVFPGLFKLITSKKYDPSLLSPVRAVATDRCTVTPDLGGWRALGCLDFLPGSLWAGASGG